MQLFSRVIEAKCLQCQAKEDLIIIHGLFGMSDNWVGIAQELSKERRVIIPDLRNHGRSPHSDDFNLELNINDLHELIIEHKCINPILLGHSLGGRIAMRYALTHTAEISKVIIADMSMRPAQLKPEHIALFRIMKNTSLENAKSYEEVKEILSKKIKKRRLILFLLKNIKKNKDGFCWKLNFLSIMQLFEQEPEAIATNEVFNGESLFIRGGNSDYLLDSDFEEIENHFPKAKLQTIEDASHWIHADKPLEFIEVVSSLICI